MPLLVKLDENLPAALAPSLSGFGYEAATVAQQGWGGLLDVHLFPLIRDEGRFFITNDKEFSDCKMYPPGSHPGILVLCPDDITPLNLRRVLVSFLQSHKLEQLLHCVVVATDHGFILRRPTPPQNQTGADSGQESAIKS